MLGIGHGPFSGSVVTRIVEALRAREPGLQVRIGEDVTPELLREIQVSELSAAVVQETPAAARRHGVRVDSLRDEPLLAALPASHDYADRGAIPIRAFAGGRVLLPREPPGRVFNAWLRAVVRAAGFELERTLEILSAPWDRRMLPVAKGEAVSLLVAEWQDESMAGVVAVAVRSAAELSAGFGVVLAADRHGGNACRGGLPLACQPEGWLKQRPPRAELPDD